MRKITLERMSVEEKFEEALATMMHGVQAVKFHYSKMAHEKCSVKISPDFKHFVWTYYHGKFLNRDGPEKSGKCNDLSADL